MSIKSGLEGVPAQVVTSGGGEKSSSFRSPFIQNKKQRVESRLRKRFNRRPQRPRRSRFIIKKARGKESEVGGRGKGQTFNFLDEEFVHRGGQIREYRWRSRTTLGQRVSKERETTGG